MMSKYLGEVETRVKKTGNTTPAQRLAFRQGYSFSRMPHSEQLAVWDHIWHHTTDRNTRSHCVMYCETFCTKPEILASSWATIVGWQDAVDEWGICDFLSKIYTKILETIPDQVYPQLQKWNQSPDLWQRRQSIVSLLYFASTKKVYLPYGHIIPLIDRLLNDPEYYVQKAVGWSLKELSVAYPEEAYSYMMSNIHIITGIAFSPATERLTPAQKRSLKEKRK